MNIHGIRLTNYNRLLREFIARDDQQGLPAHGLLKRFCEFAGVSPRYMSHINNGRKNIGGALARRLESAFGYPDGWMDRENADEVVAETNPEAEFIATALRLYRESPGEVQGVLMRYMVEKLEAKKGRLKRP